MTRSLSLLSSFLSATVLLSSLSISSLPLQVTAQGLVSSGEGAGLSGPTSSTGKSLTFKDVVRVKLQGEPPLPSLERALTTFECVCADAAGYSCDPNECKLPSCQVSPPFLPFSVEDSHESHENGLFVYSAHQRVHQVD